MTGLDVTTDTIMEMACIVTDKHLNVLEEGPNIVIHQVGQFISAIHQVTGRSVY